MVVIGTTLDEEVKDELRVTVVATGLGQDTVRMERDMRLVAQAAGSDVDYKRFDMPTVIRKQPAKDKEPIAEVDTDSEYLDIPAFLRRQAD